MSADQSSSHKQEENEQLSIWLLPTIFYVVHGVAALMFSAGSGHLTGPEADAGGMVWIAWMLIDFPIGLLAVSVGELAPTNVLAVLLVALIGGIQWVLWGLLATWIARKLQGKR